MELKEKGLAELLQRKDANRLRKFALYYSIRKMRNEEFVRRHLSS
jgi:hypothetical protein